LRPDYLLRRFGVFLIIVWLAASLNFFIPKFSGQDPIREKLLQQAARGGYLQAGFHEMVEEYQRKFGLDKPLWVQYRTFLWDVSRLKFGYSIAHYPKTVNALLRDSLPWTIGLLLMTTLIAFGLGTFLGALLAWGRAPQFLKYLLPGLLTLSAVPYYLLGLVLLYFLAFENRWFPLFGGYTAGTMPDLTWRFVADAARHSALPALSIVLAGAGFWALGMRGMMVTTQGEDYMTMGEAKGLKGSTLFVRYAMRNALLPQTTALALSLGSILSGAVLVEVVFGYPGIGTTLYHSIRQFDYFAIQGVVFTIIVSIALATFVLDVIYPLLDPRITYRQA
jgi:peptide/nickel transport system permease protein